MFLKEIVVAERSEMVQPQQEPAEGARPEEEEDYERGEEELSSQPLMEPAEGADDDIEER